MKTTNIGAVSLEIPSIQEQREKHEKDVFTIWLDNKTKIETRTFKTISSVSDIQLLSAVFQPH